MNNGRHTGTAITETVPAWDTRQWWRDEEPDSRPSHRCAFSCGWRHFRDASIAAFFLALCFLVLITITHVLGWHL